jgi:hypothetical protein
MYVPRSPNVVTIHNTNIDVCIPDRASNLFHIAAHKFLSVVAKLLWITQPLEWLHGTKTRLKTHGPLNRQLTLYWTRNRRDRFNPLKPKLRERWERQMKSKFKEEMKGRSERDFIFRGGRKNIVLLEGSQATPARPSGGNNVKVKTLW